MQITDRNGIMVGALQVSLDDEIMLMSQNGVLVRTPVKDISVVGRNTQGVRLIRLEEGDQLSGLERIEGLAGEGDDAERRRTPNLPIRLPATHKASVRAFNFSPGPAVLPLEVLEEARAELLDWNGSGMSVMEISHRSASFMDVAAQAEADLRELMSIPPNYKVLFMQGGASAQFSLVPLNLSAPNSTADYVNTGHWSQRGITEAARYCAVHVAADAGGGLPPRAAAAGAALQRPRGVCALHAE